VHWAEENYWAMGTTTKGEERKEVQMHGEIIILISHQQLFQLSNFYSHKHSSHSSPEHYFRIRQFS
jgi:hypothetical protein